MLEDLDKMIAGVAVALVPVTATVGAILAMRRAEGRRHRRIRLREQNDPRTPR